MSTKEFPSPIHGRGWPEGPGAGAKRMLTKRAKAMRSSQTDAEECLWYYLRAHRFLGLKFKRQKAIGTYIIDFVCLEKNLAIEVDGGQHSEQQAYDRTKDRALAKRGLKVLRFWNNEVLEQTQAVLEAIRQAVDTPSPPTPLPQAGEGSE